MCFHTFSLTAYHTYTWSNNISKSVRVTTGDHKFILRYDSYILSIKCYSIVVVEIVIKNRNSEDNKI